MSGFRQQTTQDHRHTEVKRLAIGQRHGVPYEVERKVCTACAEVLGERPIKRAAA
jgi:hypothetical protein